MSLSSNQKHKSFCNIENRLHLPFKPQTSEVKGRVFPGITIKDQNSNTSMTHSLQLFMNIENQPTLNGFFHKLSKKTSIKLKLFKSKKRKISRCNLGIGYDTEPHELGTSKLAQDFFPQRTLSLFKKIAFKNSTANLFNSTFKQRDNQFKKNDKSKVELRLKRQKTSVESRNEKPQIQLKIKSICSRSHSRGKSFDEITLASFKKTRERPSPQRKSETNDLQPTEMTVKEEILSPWGFEEIEDQEIEDGNTLVKRN